MARYPLPVRGPALLFCPADRPDRYEKAAAAADSVILDLEDAVAPADKPGARDSMAASDLDPSRTIIRINPASTDDCAADLAALARTPYAVVMLAKAESVHDIETLVTRGRPGLRVLALCETARGVLRAEQLAACPQVVGLMWGAEDLLASLGGTASRLSSGEYRDVARHARSRILLAAAAHGKAAIDAVHLDIGDLVGLATEAQDAAAIGFAATACIHPSQAGTIREAYRPTAEQLDWARAVLSAAVGQPGVFRFRGQMVDGPVLAQAQGLIATA